MAIGNYKCECGNEMFASLDTFEVTIVCDVCGKEAEWEEFQHGELSGDHIFVRREDLSGPNRPSWLQEDLNDHP